MAHIGGGASPLERTLELFKPGDVVTHALHGRTGQILDAAGRLLPAVVDARRRGVVMDVGHGSGNLSFAVAERAAAAGWFPDTISSDIHSGNVNVAQVVEYADDAVEVPGCAGHAARRGGLARRRRAHQRRRSRYRAGGDALARPAAMDERATILGSMQECEFDAHRLAAGILASRRRRMVDVATVRDGELVTA